MLLRGDRRDLAPLRSTSPHTVTIVAAHALGGRVIAMTEHRPENIPPWRRPPVRSDLVTDVARADLAFRRVTGVAIRVRTKTDRYRLRRTGRIVTRRTSLRRTPRTGDMVGVNELHIEAFDKTRREGSHRGRVGLVADRAHRLLVLVCELAYVAADTRIVTGILELKRCTLAAVT